MAPLPRLTVIPPQYQPEAQPLPSLFPGSLPIVSLPVITTQYRALVEQSGASSGQAVPGNNVFTKINFDFVDVDPSGSYDAINSQYVCPVSGIYFVTANVKVQIASAGPTLDITYAQLQCFGSSLLYVVRGPAFLGDYGSSVVHAQRDEAYIGLAGMIQAAAGDQLVIRAAIKGDALGYKTNGGGQVTYAHYAYLGPFR